MKPGGLNPNPTAPAQSERTLAVPHKKLENVFGKASMCGIFWIPYPSKFVRLCAKGPFNSLKVLVTSSLGTYRASYIQKH